MEVLQLHDFLTLFSKPTPGFKEFVRVAKVRVGSHLHPLRDYIKTKNIEIEDIKEIWSNLRSRNEYLTRFYEMSLRIHPERIHFENPMKNKAMNNNQEPIAKNLIRNLHFCDILKNTQSGIENNVT